MCPGISGFVNQPAGTAPDWAQDAPGPARPSLAGRRVLVVEDEYFLADDMACALRQLGAEVVGPVPTRDDALAHLAGGTRIDAAVLDINLRGQASFAVADVLIARGVPFVFASGYGQAIVPPAYGHVPHWEKPVRPEDLVRALPGLVQGN